MEQTFQKLDSFQEDRGQLLTWIGRLTEQLNDLGLPKATKPLAQIAARLENESFKLLVIGEFNRGKSTFINALLGEDVLPAFMTPTTAIINEIHWADRKYATLHPRPDQTDAEPFEIPVSELEKHIVIPKDRKKAKNWRQPYEKAEIFWPLPLCKNSVVLIDSPGLNEAEARQEITLGYISTADAVLFVLAADHLAASSELEIIDSYLRMSGHEDSFFVCNKFDLVPRRERDEIRQRALENLQPRTRLGEAGVYFLSARDALEGIEDSDEARVSRSGLPELNESLESFLAYDRGRVKLLGPARGLKHHLQIASRRIPEQRAMLRSDLGELEKRFAGIRKPLEQLQTERRRIVRRIEQFAQDIHGTVTDRTLAFYGDLADQLPKWSAAYESQSSFSIFSVSSKKQAEELTREVVEHLKTRIEEETHRWRAEELQPDLEVRIDSLVEELDERAQRFLRDVDHLRLEMHGESEGDDHLTIAHEEISALERVISAAGGFVIGGVGSAGIGALYGYKEMAKSLLPNLAVGTLAILLVGLNPWIIIPALLTTGFLQGLLKAGKAEEKIKVGVADKIAQGMKDNRTQRAEEIADSVGDQVSELKQHVDQGLSAEIAAVEEEVEAALAKRRKGQEAVDLRLRQLDAIAATLCEIDGQVDELFARLHAPGPTEHKEAETVPIEELAS